MYVDLDTGTIVGNNLVYIPKISEDEFIDDLSDSEIIERARRVASHYFYLLDYRTDEPDGTDYGDWEPDDLGYGNPNIFICTDYGCSGCGARNCPTS